MEPEDHPEPLTNAEIEEEEAAEEAAELGGEPTVGRRLWNRTKALFSSLWDWLKAFWVWLSASVMRLFKRDEDKDD